MNIKPVLEFAKESHRGQFRKDGVTPYIEHPLAICSELHNLHITSRAITDDLSYNDYAYYSVALMHDLLEDTEATVEEIVGVSDVEIAQCVECLTYKKEDENPFSKTYYLKHICDTFLPRVHVIKCVDRLCNTRDFMASGDRRYAKKYFHKADILWATAWECRRETAYNMLWPAIYMLNAELQE